MWGHGWAANGEDPGAAPQSVGLTGVARLSLGGGYGPESFACALMMTGQTLCWGRDTEGQLGDGPDNADKLTPVPVAWP